MSNLIFRIGDIFWVDFSVDSVGHEYQKKRPALIIQSDRITKISNLITVLPLTSKSTKIFSEDILVCKDERNLLHEDSLIKVKHIMSFDQQRFYHKIGEVDEAILQKVKQYLKLHFDL